MREWGTLRAMGTKKRDILLLVLYEGCLQGLIGAIIGIAAGFAIAGLIDVTGGLTYRNGLQAFAIMVLALDTVWINLFPANRHRRPCGAPSRAQSRTLCPFRVPSRNIGKHRWKEYESSLRWQRGTCSETLDVPSRR